MYRDKGNLDIRSLKYFISAAQHLNFTSAAKECYITQTAMSMHIAKIEEDLGFKLFVRRNRKVMLTPAGAELYKSVKKIVKIYESAVTYSSGIAEGIEGSVKMLLTSSIDAMYFIERFRKFKDDNPNIILDIHIVEPRDVFEILNQKEADLAFCWPYDFASKDEYTVRIIDKSTICAAMNPRHELAKKYKSIRIEDLINERIIAISEGGMPDSYYAIRSLIQDAGINSSEMIKVHTLEEILINIEMNHGIAILPQYVERMISHNRIEFLSIENSEHITFDLAVVYPNQNPKAASKKLLESFPEV